MPLELPKIKLDCVQQTFGVKYVLLISNSLKIGEACVEYENSIYQNIGLPKWYYTLTKPNNRVYYTYDLDFGEKIGNNSYTWIHELAVVWFAVLTQKINIA